MSSQNQTVALFAANNQATGTFTAATTGTITSTAHGLTAGTPIVLTTSNTLPAGLSLATIYYVQNPTANTFTLSPYATGNGFAPTITSTGTGTHTWTLSSVSPCFAPGEADSVDVELRVSGTVSMTVKIFGTLLDTIPNPLATQSATNEFTYLGVIDRDTGNPSTGATGIVLTTAGTYRYQINVNPGSKFIGAYISTYSNGTLTATAVVQGHYYYA